MPRDGSEPEKIKNAVWKYLCAKSDPRFCPRIAHAAETAKEYGAARVGWERGAESGDVHAAYHWGLALHADGDEEAALASLQFAMDGGFDQAAFRLATIYEKRGDLQKAEQYLRTVANDDRPDGLSALGDLLRRHNRLDEAERWFRRAVGLGEPWAQCALGDILFARGDTVEAKAQFEASLESGHAHAGGRLGLIRFREGDEAAARNCWETAESGCKGTDLCGLGSVLHECGEDDWALRVWESAAATGHTHSLLLAARLYISLSRELDAEQALHNLAETDASEVRKLGKRYYAKGLMEAAQLCFRVAPELDGPRDH